MGQGRVRRWGLNGLGTLGHRGMTGLGKSNGLVRQGQSIGVVWGGVSSERVRNGSSMGLFGSGMGRCEGQEWARHVMWEGRGRSVVRSGRVWHVERAGKGPGCRVVRHGLSFDRGGMGCRVVRHG